MREVKAVVSPVRSAHFRSTIQTQLKGAINQPRLFSFQRVPLQQWRNLIWPERVNPECVSWAKCLGVSRHVLTEARGRCYCCTPPRFRTLYKKNDATDGSERERKRTRPSGALNWDDVGKEEKHFSRLITQLGDPDTSTRRGWRRCFVSCPFRFVFSFSPESEIKKNYNSVWEKSARWRSIFAAAAAAGAIC